jgi:hypothetical protein
MNDEQKIKTKKEMQIEGSNMDNKEFSAPIWSKEEKELSRTLYGCEIIQEKCSQQELKNTELPNDTYIVSYYQNKKLFYDLVRGKRVKIFDMYWDKIRDNLQKIDWGYGRINPKLWGYQAPKTKKRK